MSNRTHILRTARNLAVQTGSRTTVPVRRERTLDSVIGYLHSTSFAAPHLFGDRMEEFDQALRDRLPVHATRGVFVDENEFNILLATRP
jgi:hypothetical protein